MSRSWRSAAHKFEKTIGGDQFFFGLSVFFGKYLHFIWSLVDPEITLELPWASQHERVRTGQHFRFSTAYLPLFQSKASICFLSSFRWVTENVLAMARSEEYPRIIEIPFSSSRKARSTRWPVEIFSDHHFFQLNLNDPKDQRWTNHPRIPRISKRENNPVHWKIDHQLQSCLIQMTLKVFRA